MQRCCMPVRILHMRLALEEDILLKARKFEYLGAD